MKEISIFISEEVKKRIQLYTNLATGEISWIGDISFSNNQIRVSDVYLIEQDTSDDKTKLREKAYAQFVMDYFSRGKDPANLKLWIHSHGDGLVFWSSDDEATIETHNRADFFVSIVVNKRGDFLARVDIFRPFRVKLDNVNIFTPTIYSPEDIQEAKMKIQEIVHYHPRKKGELPIVTIFAKKKGEL